ncbi:MAG: hypothetical protein COV67_00690 [Nitrospinae bacterium CG11_big_fil_rev_8_21_14_0_20_56_8]|nr:MAG: hypothetical protein COV67_00690 [Nitrospinae bacterium CG11_big_fil_rev_8_21_14_0_20_56_8]
MLFVSATVVSADPNVNCSDYRWVKVAWVEDGNLPTLADAGYTFNGVPVIRYNPNLAKGTDPSMLRFAYYRECGRHALGLTLTTPASIADARARNVMADCFAISRLYYSDDVGDKEVEAIQYKFGEMLPEQWKIFPGPRRVVDLKKECYLKPFNP